MRDHRPTHGMPAWQFTASAVCAAGHLTTARWQGFRDGRVEIDYACGDSPRSLTAEELNDEQEVADDEPGL